MRKEKLYQGIRSIKHDLKETVDLNSDRQYVILVAGGSASGKTSLVAKRIESMFGDDALLLSMDNYYIGARYAEENSLSYDDPEALDLALFFKHLKSLKEGKEVVSPIYDFKKSIRSEKTQILKPKKVIIVEGLYALHNSLESLGDYKIFVEIGTHGRALRRVFRDVNRTGQFGGDILKYFLEVVEPKNTEHIEPTKDFADIVIENEYIPYIESRNAKSLETHLKFKLNPSERDKVGKVIRHLGGVFVGEVDDSDHFLSTKNGFNPGDEILKVNDVGNDRYLLHYKGPDHMTKEYESRYGVNFMIDKDTFGEMKKVYGQVIKIINKKRFNYYFKGFLISVDEFESGEMYLDIRFEEGVDLGVLEKILREISLEMKSAIKKPYFLIIE